MNKLPMSSGLFIERFSTWITAGLVFVAACVLRGRVDIAKLDPHAELATKVVDVAAVFFAYALTALTILPAINDRNAVKRLRAANMYHLICQYLGEALFSNGFLVVYGLAIKVCIDHSDAVKSFAVVLSAFWWAAVTFSVVALLRVSRLMVRLVSAN